jgi:hypothetical protein
MINAGSKGGELNVVQMAACLGQQKVEGHLPPLSLTAARRPITSPLRHRGARLVESFLLFAPQRVLPRDAGRGAQHTAVKSVTGDTDVVLRTASLSMS